MTLRTTMSFCIFETLDVKKAPTPKKIKTNSVAINAALLPVRTITLAWRISINFERAIELAILKIREAKATQQPNDFAQTGK